MLEYLIWVALDLLGHHLSCIRILLTYCRQLNFLSHPCVSGSTIDKDTRHWPVYKQCLFCFTILDGCGCKGICKRVATAYFALLKRFIVGPYWKFSVRICVLLPGIKTVALLCVFSVSLKEQDRQCTVSVT